MISCSYVSGSRIVLACEAGFSKQLPGLFGRQFTSPAADLISRRRVFAAVGVCDKFSCVDSELEIWKFAAERLRGGAAAVMLLVVAESSGSSPGRRGFKMIVADGEMRGSIGGGVMEVALVEQAKLLISNFKLSIGSQIVEQVHQKNSPHSSGMICSGRQTIILRKLTADDFKTIEKIISRLTANDETYLQIAENKFQLVRHETSSFDFNFVVNNPNGLKDQNRLMPDDIAANIADETAAGGEIKSAAAQASAFFYEEKLGFKNKLYIIGGGHCALALSELMTKMDFHISLFDDRSDLNTLAKNEYVHEKKIIESYEQIGEFIEGGNNIYVVVMTLGYKYDEIVIRQLIDKNFKYFGVLGSRAKMKALLKSLENEGVDKENLARIKTPIGLKINSHTPAEIAVSIAAEIISIKNS